MPDPQSSTTTPSVGPLLLTQEQLAQLLRDAPRWSLQQGRLTRTWTFPDFLAALAFVQRVGAIAEQANHHPDIDIRYNQVQLALISHDVGGITPRDARMVLRLDESFPA